MTVFLVLLGTLLVSALIGLLVYVVYYMEVDSDEKPPSVDMNTPVEELHKIVKRRFVTDEYNPSRVLAKVVCVCGWSTVAVQQESARDRGDQHVQAHRERVRQERETARKVAEKLAENEKGDFAW